MEFEKVSDTVADLEAKKLLHTLIYRLQSGTKVVGTLV